MLDLITKGYISAKLKIEDLTASERGLVGLEYVVLGAVIVGTLVVVFGTGGAFETMLKDAFTKLQAKIGSLLKLTP